ncbi:MAG: hypothetical protein KBT02_04950 [Treponema sp.]|nr:hypothetical protein [Candidatus Treponema caballi]
MKRFVLPVIILTLCIFLTSCGNLFQKTLPGITPAPETTDTAATSNGSGTVTFTGNIGISGAFPKEIADTFTRKGTSGNAARTAFPSAPTETAYYVEVNDTSVTPNKVVDSINSPALFNINQDTGVFSLPLELNHAYTITVSIIKTNDSSKKPLLSDSVSNVKLTATAPVYVHDFTLNPVTDSGTGNVSLPLSIMVGAEPAITKITDLKTGKAISSNTLTFTAGETTGSGNNAITAYTLAASDIPAGAYAVSFEVFSRLSAIANQREQTPAVSPYNDSEEYRVGTMRTFFTTQTINVYKNMTTDTWVNNGNLPIGQNGVLSVDSTTSMMNIQTVFYVDSGVAQSGNGTYDKPFKTLNEAMFCITGGSNSGKPVYIHIKNGYQETFSSTYPKRVSGATYAFIDNVTVEIECWKNTVGDGKGTATILTSGSSVSPIFGLSTNKADTGPTVTLRGLTLSGSGATNATGIELVNGNLTLENCQITGFQTAGINVSGGSLTVSGFTDITGNGTSGAISNVKLPAGMKINVGTLTSGSIIGVTTATAWDEGDALIPFATYSTKPKDDVFFSDAGYPVTLGDSEASIGEAGSVSTDIYVNNTTGNDETGTGKKSKPYKTLAKAVEMVSEGGAIFLARDQTFCTGNMETITISKNLTIGTYGEGNCPALDSTRLKIESDPEVRINNIVFKMTAVTGTSSGVFIYNDNAKVTCFGCTFTGGKATVGDYAYGGAIYNKGELTVTDCTFTGNAAGNHGGAIYTTNKATISGCTFSDNKADVQYNAIAFDKELIFSGTNKFTTASDIPDNAKQTVEILTGDTASGEASIKLESGFAVSNINAIPLYFEYFGKVPTNLFTGSAVSSASGKFSIYDTQNSYIITDTGKLLKQGLSGTIEVNGLNAGLTVSCVPSSKTFTFTILKGNEEIGNDQLEYADFEVWCGGEQLQKGTVWTVDTDGMSINFNAQAYPEEYELIMFFNYKDAAYTATFYATLD